MKYVSSVNGKKTLIVARGLYNNDVEIDLYDETVDVNSPETFGDEQPERSWYLEGGSTTLHEQVFQMLEELGSTNEFNVYW
jgi:hypothetical protein